MIKRIVRLTFREDGVDTFLSNFQKVKTEIRNQPGCLRLELQRQKDDTNVFFTISIWESENHLNAYRNSAFFKTLWPMTKALFADKPSAWTLQEEEILD